MAIIAAIQARQSAEDRMRAAAEVVRADNSPDPGIAGMASEKVTEMALAH